MTIYQGYENPSPKTHEGLHPNSDYYSQLRRDSFDHLISIVGEKRAYDLLWKLGNYHSAYYYWTRIERLISELEKE